MQITVGTNISSQLSVTVYDCAY